MFEKALEQKFKALFGVKKVDYALPGESQEQECLFVNIESAKPMYKDAQVNYRVEGVASIYGNAKKIPFGFFSNQITNPKLASLTKDIFFYEVESSTRTYRDIVERSFSFVYFFTSQYDPKIGTITSLDQEIIINEES